MLRGLADIVEPLVHIGEEVRPYLGAAINGIRNGIREAMPRLVDPENAFWIYSVDGELSLKSAVVGMADAISTIHPNYLLVAATFVAAFFILYIKLKYPFWNQIPALHIYDWHRRFLYSDTPYIIHHIPKKTKYYERSPLIQTQLFRDLGEDRKLEITKLLQNYYLPSDRVFCSIQLPDLAAQCSDSLISTYNQVEYDLSPEMEKTTNIRAIHGFAASRRIQMALALDNQKSVVVQEPANYIDYICFDKTGGGVSSSPTNIRKLFHTHEYNARSVFPDRQITVFKKEVELCDAIVPFVEYEALTFYLRFQIKPAPLPANYQMVRIQREHLRHLHDWMERVASLKEDAGFRVSMTGEMGYLIHLLQTNQMFAYVLRGPDKDAPSKLDAVYAIYFFRNGHMKYEDLDGGDTLHSVGAFCNTGNFELYFLGFVWAVREARKDLSGTETKMLMVDDIGHLRGVAARWRQTHDVVLKTKCAYYCCNYVVPRSPYAAVSVNVLI